LQSLLDFSLFGSLRAKVTSASLVSPTDSKLLVKMAVEWAKGLLEELGKAHWRGTKMVEGIGDGGWGGESKNQFPGEKGWRGDKDPNP
jgi:hypothetical protein